MINVEVTRKPLQKKPQKTRKADIELAASRFAQIGD